MDGILRIQWTACSGISGRHRPDYAGLVAPGILIAFIAAAVSRDLWQFVTEITWIQIAIMSVLILIFTLGNLSTLRKGLDEVIQELDLEQIHYSSDRLYAAIVRSVSYSESKKVPRQLFDSYQDYFSWKWYKPIGSQARADLTDELIRRAKWRFFLSMLILMPVLFIFMFILGALIFPAETLFAWTGVHKNLNFLTPIIYAILSDETTLSSVDWGAIIENPTVKFSAISTLLLLADFVVSYAQDGKRIFSSLHLDKNSLCEWLTILFAFHIVKEREFQFIASIWTSFGHGFQKLWYFAPIVLVPNNADKALIERAIPRLQELRSLNHKLISAIFINTDGFYNTPLALGLYLEPNNEYKENATLHPSNIRPACWAWMNGEIFEFPSLNEAQLWIKDNSK